MAHIKLPDGVPGINAPLTAYPAVRQPMADLANAVMSGPSSLTRGERELIAAYVSSRNECQFCTLSHASAARHLLDENSEIVYDVLAHAETADISEKLRALLSIAELVRIDGKMVTEAQVKLARDNGADDQAIHDTVLIAAMFGMFNRYVDGLAAWTPDDPAVYEESGARVAAQGYGSKRYD